MGLADAALLAAATAERRALVTENVRDFAIAHARQFGAAEPHFGIVFTSRARFPRDRERRGALVDVLERFLRERPAEGGLRGDVHWLS